MIPKTENGYVFFEASSTLQKAIRRGDEETAMFFMVELFNSGYEEYIWKRYKIIVSEDIGLAQPTLPATIAALYSFFAEAKKDAKDTRPERIYLAHATVILANCKKSRYADYAMIYHWRTHKQNVSKFPIPDYALDQHTLRGKQMGRSVDHFFNVGAHIENAAGIAGEDAYKKRAIKARIENPGKLVFAKKVKGQPGIFDIKPEDAEETE